MSEHLSTIAFSLAEVAMLRIDNFTQRPTIVFLHDSLGCIELWRGFPQQLGELTQCNVLVYDRQGYGKSGAFSYQQRDNSYMEHEADILNALLAYCNIDQAILFGHSDGGSIALIAAAKYPTNIKGVVTEGAHVWVEELTLNGIREAIQLYRTTDLKQKLAKYHGEKTDDMFWAWAATWTNPPFATWNITHFLPHIICPTLVIQGEDDEYGTAQQVQQIVKQTHGHATALMIPHVKHTPHKEATDLVLARSAQFIAQLLI